MQKSLKLDKLQKSFIKLNIFYKNKKLEVCGLLIAIYSANKDF